MSTLALFDLDHTLLPFDSDTAWRRFLLETQRVPDPQAHVAYETEMLSRYRAGKLSVPDCIRLCMLPLTFHPVQELARFHEEYMSAVVRPGIQPQALELVQSHLQAGHLCALVSATNSFVIDPIGRAFGFEHVLGIIPERKGDRFTGQYLGTPTYQEGKITRVEAWLEGMGLNWDDFETQYFYSDSKNDLPMLRKVTHPVATNPDAIVREEAQKAGWKILELF